MASKIDSKPPTDFFKAQQEQVNNPFRTRENMQTPDFQNKNKNQPQKVSFQDSTLDEGAQMIPEREKEIKFGNEVNEIYLQHIRDKEKIRSQIESLTREKDFIERLKPDDVLYMLQKKQEARLTKEIEDFDKRYLQVENNRKLSAKNNNYGAPDYTRIKADREEMIQILDEDKLTKDQRKKLDGDRILFKQQAEAQNAAYPDEFFSKITETEVKNLQQRVQTKRRDNALTVEEKSSVGKSTVVNRNVQQEIDEYMKTNSIGLNRKLDLVTQAQKYYEAITEYYDGGLANEAEVQRQETLHNLKSIRIMDRYLVDFDQGFDMDQTQREGQSIDRFMEGKELPRQYRKKEIRDIKVWTDIVGSVEKNQWLQSQNVHLDKLEEYRSTKKWQKACQDDQDDIEADQIISDIKNLNHEKHFNTVNSWLDVNGDIERLSKNDKKHNKDFNSTLMQNKDVKVATQDREALDKIFGNKYTVPSKK